MNKRAKLKMGALIRALLTPLMVISLVCPQPLHAAELSCPVLFTRTSPAAASAGTNSSPVAESELLKWSRFSKLPPFDLKQFYSLRQNFIDRLKRNETVDQVEELKTPTAKLAFLEAVGQVKGAGLFRFGAFLKVATPSERKAIGKAISKLDFAEQPDWTTAQKTMVKLYLISHAHPTAKGIVEMFKTPWIKLHLDMIFYRVNTAVARHSIPEALSDLGLIKGPVQDRETQEKIRRIQDISKIPWSFTLMAVSSVVPFFNPKSPDFLAATKDPSADQLERFVQGGGKVLEEEIKTHYHWTAESQQTMTRIMYVLTVALMPLLIHMLFDDFKELGDEAYFMVTGERLIKPDTKVRLTPAEREKLVDKIVERELKMLEASTRSFERRLSPEEKKLRMEQLRTGPEMQEFRESMKEYTDSEIIIYAE